MTNLIGSEFLKLRTTRSFWWVAGLSIAFPALITVAQLASETIATESDARSLFSNMGIAGLLILVLGAVGSGGEYRHGTITSTFLVAPDRRRVLVAKALAYGLTGLAVTVGSALLVLAISLPWLSADRESLGSLNIGGAELLGIFAGAAAYVAISGMLGSGAGALLANQVTAIVGVLVFLFILDPTLSALIDGYSRFSLSGIGVALSGGTDDDTGSDIFSPGVAALVYLGYAAAITAAAAAVAQRRDVS